MKIPLYIPIAKERAATFRKGVHLFVERYEGRIPEGSLRDLWMIVRAYSRDSMHFVEPLEIDVPLVVESALTWAHQQNKLPIETLREAHSLLQAALADWFAAWSALGKVVATDGHRLSYDHWLKEVIPLALSRHQQASRSLSDGWPIPSLAEEQQAVAEIKAGMAIELDAAFAQIAGLSKEQWSGKVDQHKKRSSGAGE